jgi:alanine transaminase
MGYRILNKLTKMKYSHKAFVPGKRLTLKDINQETIDAKYAVRGMIPIIADQLNEQLSKSPENKLPFDKIINANIGNPQQLEQNPLTWYRQVLSILQYPALIHNDDVVRHFPKDVITRATTILGKVGSVGAYSHSQGAAYFRESVAKFIEKRDGFPSDPNQIYLTSGASAAVSYLLQVLSNNEQAGFLIPIPQYPLYTATIALNKAKPIGYFLDESNNWSTDPEQIRSLIEEQKAKGVNIKALVVINPGNPTGSILSVSDIEHLIDIAAEYGIVLIADEVYQENIFEGKFTSMKKVLCELTEKNPELYSGVQLASLHSTSKGVSGECGQRGGYMELTGFKKEIADVIFKLASINLCSVVSGQALMELMVNPPQKGDESYALYKQETEGIMCTLKERAELLYQAFNQMENITCNKPMGAMYLFPRLNFDEESFPALFEEARNDNLQVDDIYCIALLRSTGICCIPGNGFGQVEGTYHLRTTFLAPGTEWIDQWSKFHNDFIEKFKK